MRPLIRAALGLLTLAACSTSPQPRGQGFEPVPKRSNGPPSVTPSRLIDLPVPGHGAAVVVTPSTTAPAPLTVVLHGSWDRPEWVCDVFSRISRGRGWVLCLRGTLRPERPEDGPRWSFGKPAQTLAEIDAAVAALKRHYGGHIQPGPAVLAGFSKGAYQAAWLASRDPKRWPRLMLTEGGHSSFGKRAIKRFAKAGQAVAWGCGTASCQKASERGCARLRRAGVACRVETDLRVGHSYNPPYPGIGRILYGWLLDQP